MSNPAESQSQLPVMRSAKVQSVRHRARWVRKAVRWIATAALFTWLFISTNWQGVLGSFQSASIAWLCIAAGVYLASQFASVARWELLVRAANLNHSRTRLLAAYFAGMFVNVCLPTTIGGDALKVLRVGGTQNKRLAAATVVADRASGLIALLGLLAIGLILTIDVPRIVAACAVAALLGVSVLASWILRRGATLAASISNKPNGFRPPLITQVLRFIPANVQQLATKAPWFHILAWAFMVQGLNIAAVWAAARAIGLDVPLTAIAVATTTVSLASALPISVAGLGVREASLPLLLAAHGVPRELAVALGIVWSGIVLTVGLTGGPVYFVGQFRATDDLNSSASDGLTGSRRAA